MTDHFYFFAFIKGFIITCAVEIPVVLILMRCHFRKAGGQAASIRIVAAAFAANMLTLPYLWFVYPEFFDFIRTVAVGEATALVAEALFYRLFLGATIRAAFSVSFIANAGSVLAGLVIMPPFG